MNLPVVSVMKRPQAMSWINRMAATLVIALCAAGIADAYASKTQCPGYITGDEAILIAEFYAAQQNKTYMDEETNAMWFPSYWSVDVRTDAENSGDRVSNTLSEDGKAISCDTASTRCAQKPDWSYVKCLAPAENRLAKGEITQAARNYLNSHPIPFSGDGAAVHRFEGGYWSVSFLGSLRVGDRFTIIVSHDGKILRYIGGA